MRLSWLACIAFFSGVSGCGSSSSSSSLFGGAGNPVPPGTGGSSAGGSFPGAGGIIASGGAAGFSTGGISGFSASGGFQPFPTGGFTGLPDGSIGSGGEGGAASSCPVGHYSGSYAGMYGGLFNMTPVGGNIDFTVDASGAVTGTYQGTNPNNGSKADLVGTVDCTTFALDMRVENGAYPGVLGSTIKFSGTMPGNYSADTRAWSGTWKLTDSNSQSGSGSWTAQ